jgi:ornithine carbamoyltransferase
MDDMITLKDVAAQDVEDIFESTAKLKGKLVDTLRGKTLAMVFEKPSTRTRVSFEVAMYQLGGHAIFLTQKDTQLSRGENLADTAKVLAGYVDAVVARVYQHRHLAELAKFSDVPVINGLSDYAHPCQVLADLCTVLERKGTLDLKFAWLGDGNNVCNSLIFAQEKLGFELAIATPPAFEPTAAQDVPSNEKLTLTNDPLEAVRDAHVVYTDSWVSMGQEGTRAKRIDDLRSYQVNAALTAGARPDFVFMHPLPAYRGYEVTPEVIDGPHSIVWLQAENRLHVQKAILSLLIKV